jgi:hypothetical protein
MFATALCAILFGLSSNAQNARPSQSKVLPPAPHVIIDSPPSASNPVQPAPAVETKEKPKPSFFGPEWVIVYITGAYALIAGWTLLAIQKQVKLMKVQADIATSASTAATNSARFFANAERARLVVSVTAQTEFDFDVFAINSGRSPAKLTHAVVTGEWLRRGEALGEVPDYSDMSDYPEADFARSEWVLPKAEILLGSETPSTIVSGDEDLRQEFINGTKTIWVFGMFRYEDSVSGDEYESRFCYHVYRLSLRGKPIMFGGGPPAYKGERRIKTGSNLT